MGGPGGIHMHRIEGLVVANNHLQDVGGPGIAVQGCESVAVRGNVVPGTDASGISVVDSPETGVSDNYVESSDGAGIDCRSETGVMSGLQVTDNRCVDAGAGIALEGEIDRYLVVTNLLDGPLLDESDGSGHVTGNVT